MATGGTQDKTCAPSNLCRIGPACGWGWGWGIIFADAAGQVARHALMGTMP